MKRIAAAEQTREQLRALLDGRLGTAPDRSSLVLLAPADRGGSLGGRGLRQDWPRALRAGRWRGGGLPQRVPAGPDEDGRGDDGVLRPTGARHARAVCFGDQGEPGRPDASARGSGGRTLRAWAVDPRHRGHLHRRGWPPAALARGGERDHRAAMGGVRGVHQARSVRVPDRLSLRRWDCRAAARWPPARGGDCGLGHRRGWPQGAAASHGRLEGGYRDGAGVEQASALNLLSMYSEYARFSPASRAFTTNALDDCYNQSSIDVAHIDDLPFPRHSLVPVGCSIMMIMIPPGT